MAAAGKILMLTKGSMENPSSNLRHFNMIPYLTEAGFEVDVAPLFEDEYYSDIILIESKIRRIIRKSFYSTIRLIERLKKLPILSEYDLVVLENQLFPYEQGLLEWVATKLNAKIIVEFDDAIFLTRLHGAKLARTLKLVRHINVGNRNLAQYARQYNRNVSVIPTVFDLDEYADIQEKLEDNEIPVIGWLGQAVGLPYLEVVRDALQSLAKERKFEFRILSRKTIDIPGVQIRFVPYRMEDAKRQLACLDIGIMPLFDDIWSRYKCGGKLLHYMASGIASVASPVGVNADIIRDGENGFLASDQSQWKEKLKRLIDDVELRKSMARAGRKTAKKYSLQVWGPRIVEQYSALIDGRPVPSFED